MGLYSKKVKTLDGIKDDGQIITPLLQKAELITFKRPQWNTK